MKLLILADFKICISVPLTAESHGLFLQKLCLTEFVNVIYYLDSNRGLIFIIAIYTLTLGLKAPSKMLSLCKYFCQVSFQ